MGYLPGALLRQTRLTSNSLPEAGVSPGADLQEISIPDTQKKLALYPQQELDCEWHGKKIHYATGSLGSPVSGHSVPLRCVYTLGKEGRQKHAEFLIYCDDGWHLGLYDAEHEGFVVFTGGLYDAAYDSFVAYKEESRAILFQLNGESRTLEDYPRPQWIEWYPFPPTPKKIEEIPSEQEVDLSEGEQTPKYKVEPLSRGPESTETPAVKNNTRSRLALAALAVTALALAIILGAGGATLLGLKLGAVVSETYFFYIAGGLLGGAFLSSILTGVALWRRKATAHRLLG